MKKFHVSIRRTYSMGLKLKSTEQYGAMNMIIEAETVIWSTTESEKFQPRLDIQRVPFRQIRHLVCGLRLLSAFVYPNTTSQTRTACRTKTVISFSHWRKHIDQNKMNLWISRVFSVDKTLEDLTTSRLQILPWIPIKIVVKILELNFKRVRSERFWGPSALVLPEGWENDG